MRGRLTWDPRLERRRFKKMLPADDTLARAVGLESTQKGARFIIESQLARELLSSTPAWLTQDGYVRQVSDSGITYEHILRRISPTPDSTAYEVLYFWFCGGDLDHLQMDYRERVEELMEIQRMVGDNVGEHYKATIDLLKRCESRQKYTNKKLRGQF